MTVRELKMLLSEVPDEMEVVIPLNAGDGFDGMFFSPCVEESGVGEFPLDGEAPSNADNVKFSDHGELVEEAFTLVPCGFFQEQEGPPAELN